MNDLALSDAHQRTVYTLCGKTVDSDRGVGDILVRVFYVTSVKCKSGDMFSGKYGNFTNDSL